MHALACCLDTLAKSGLVMDVQGIMIGNGWIDPASQVWSHYAELW